MGRIEDLVREMCHPENRTTRRYAAIQLCSAIEAVKGAEDKAEAERCAIGPLAELLSDADVGLEADAMKALRAAKDAGVDIGPAVPAIAKSAVDSRSYFVKLFATGIIGELVQRMPEFAPALLKAVQDEDPLVAGKALGPLEGFVRGCNDKGLLEYMRAELNRPREIRQGDREVALRDMKRSKGRKERKAMRRDLDRRLPELRESEQVKKMRLILTLRICELDYPTLKPARRAGVRIRNAGRRLKLGLAV